MHFGPPRTLQEPSLAPSSQANSRPLQANVQSSSNFDGCVHYGGWEKVRQNRGETNCCWGDDKCGAGVDVRRGYAGGGGACLGVPALAVCRCGCLHSGRCQPVLMAFTQALHTPDVLGIQLKHGACPLHPSCCYAWVRLGCSTPPPEGAVGVLASGSTPAGHSLKSRLLFCWPLGTFHRWLTGRPFSEGTRARLPDRLKFSEGICFHRLAHRSPRFRGISSQARRPLTVFRGILLSSLGSPVAPFPRDFEPGTARLPDRSHFSEGFCFHRLAHRSPRFRGISSQAPRPLTVFRGILLSSLGSPVAPLPRDFEPGTARLPDRSQFFEGFCFHRLAHRSPRFRGISSQAPRPLTLFRGILLSSLG